MAMNVNFLKGLYSKYEGLASKDSNTFYLTYESGTNEAMGGAIRLFLGAEELTNKVDIAALREYIGTLPEGATSEDIVSYISEAITAKIGTLKIGDTSYDTVVDYVIAKTTGIATDSVVQGKADRVVPAKVNNIAILTADGNLSDGGKTIAEVEQVAKDYTDAEITGLELVLSEDGKTLNLNNKAGTAVATLDTTDFVVDGMLSSVVADQDNNKLTFTWNTDSGIKVTEIELSAIADIYTGATNKDGISINVSNTNEISAVISSALEARIAKGVTAESWGNHANAGYAKAADLGDLAGKNEADLGLNKYMTTEAHNTFVSGNAALQSGITAAKVGEYDAVKATVDANAATWSAKQNALDAAQLAATNSGITAEKVGQYDGVKSTVDTNKSTWDKAGTALQKDVADGYYAAKATETVASDAAAAAATAQETIDNYADLHAADYTNTQIDDKVKTVQDAVDAIDTGVMSVVSGTANGTIKVDDTDVAVTGLGSAAYTDSSAYATAAQGTKADNAETKLAGLTTTVKEYVDEEIRKVDAAGVNEKITALEKAVEDVAVEAANQAAVVLSEAQKYTDSQITALAEGVAEMLTWGTFGNEN